MNLIPKGLAVAGLLATTTFAHAASTSFVLKTSAEFGGDELFIAHFTNGDIETTRAGDGLQFAIGAGFEHSPTWQSEATIGFRFGGTIGENGSLEFDSVPYELLTFYHSKSGKWRAGGGLTYVTRMSLDGAGIIEGYAVDFENALGGIIEFDWFLGLEDKARVPQQATAYFGIRGTLINYERVDQNGKIDGNSLGLVLGFGF